MRCRPILMAALLTAVPVARAAPVPTECEPGVHDLTNFAARPDGSMAESRGTSTRYCGLDGELTIDEFRALGPGDEIVFRGVSLGIWDAARDAETVLWLMVGDPGLTLLANRVERDVLVSEGSGADGLGPFEERSRRTWRDDGVSEFVMDRFYPRFDRWIEPFNRILETPSSRPLPSAPERPSELLASAGPRLPRLGVHTATVSHRGLGGARGPFIETARSRLILDGHAVLTEIETRREPGGPVEGRQVRYSLVDPEPARWRQVTWDLTSHEVTVRTEPLE